MTSLIYPTQRCVIISNIISTTSSGIHLHQRTPSTHLKSYMILASTQTINTQWHNSQNYEEISKNIHHRTTSSGLPIKPAPSSSSPSPPPPILTVLDDPLFTKTTGSLISRLATLRNRNRIKRRNKTVKKADIKQNKPLKFPIRRKRSLQYKKRPQAPLFDNKKQMMDFLMNSNYQAFS